MSVPAAARVDADAATSGRRSAFRGGIEGLRGIAAVAVVVHHSWSLSSMPRFPGYQLVEGLGTWGVTLFFLLSGYLLCDHFWTPRHRGRLRGYWIRRAFRIAPAYYVTFGILFLFFAQHELAFSAQGAKQLAANLTFTHYLWPGTSSSLNVDGALWTLTIEILLYLVLPLIAVPFARWPLPTFLVTAGLGVGWRLMVAVAGDPLRQLYFSGGGPGVDVQSLYLARQFPGALQIFAVGIGLKWLTLHHGPTRRLQARLRVGVGTLVLGLLPSVVLLLWVERASNYQHWIWFSLYELAIAVALSLPLYLAGAGGWRGERPSSRLVQWFGERSYSLYIWHFPIILSVYGRGPLVNAPQLSHFWARALLIAGLSTLAAHLSYTLVEKPGIRAGKRLVATVDPAPPPAAGPTSSTTAEQPTP